MISTGAQGIGLAAWFGQRRSLLRAASRPPKHVALAHLDGHVGVRPIVLELEDQLLCIKLCAQFSGRQGRRDDVMQACAAGVAVPADAVMDRPRGASGICCWWRAFVAESRAPVAAGRTCMAQRWGDGPADGAVHGMPRVGCPWWSWAVPLPSLLMFRHLREV
ncbi:hypothetical protein [Ralstonia sp. GX3-BWBA]|uniref:hypothetical protein n=1 Tax=Ralstonia sp. GX3-BWBA TaxID=2219865 RepID=UPI001EF7C3FC|nr:hypothetical protein [Ralstonia sp. GX3-BWBA]